MMRIRTFLTGFCALALYPITGLLLAHRVVGQRNPKLVRIHAISGHSVILDINAKTSRAGEFGLWIDRTGAHIRVGGIVRLDKDAGTVERTVLRTIGKSIGARQGRWTGHVFATPHDIGVNHREVSIGIAGGTAPAWLFEPPSSRGEIWSIHIHGIRTSRVTALRTIPVALEAGHVALVPSFRGDGDGPPTAKGISTLAQTEWSDVEAAVAYAAHNGAKSIILFGWSMGAGIALLLSERSSYRNLISGLVLIAPATDWRSIICAGVARAQLPSVLGNLTARTLESALLSKLVGLPVPLNLDALDWVSAPRLSKPCLVIHSAGDTEIPLGLSRRFRQVNAETVELVEFPAADHACEYNVDHQRFNDTIASWLARTTANDGESNCIA